MVSRSCPHFSGIVVGVDTHKDEHLAVVVDHLGVHISQQRFPTTDMGYASLERWASRLGEVKAFGVEGHWLLRC
jgi:transposase